MASLPLTSEIKNLNLECSTDSGSHHHHHQRLGAIPKNGENRKKVLATTPQKKKKSVFSYSTPELIRRVPDSPSSNVSTLSYQDDLLLHPPEPIPQGCSGSFHPSRESVPKSVKRRGRRRGRRRKEDDEDEENLSKTKTEDKENQCDDEGDNEDLNYHHLGKDRKFIWKNLTKNGSIKKCILVDGIVEGGRPQVGDAVLVKSQGKLKDGRIVDDYPTLVFHVGDYEVIEGLDLAVQSMYKNELSIISVKPDMAYGTLGRKHDIPSGARITYLFGLLHFEKEKEIKNLTWAQRRKSGQSRMRLANWWYQRKEYPIAVKCYKKALQFYNDIPTNQECSSPEEYKELLQLMEERLRVMRQVANIFKRIANLIQSGQINT